MRISAFAALYALFLRCLTAAACTRAHRTRCLSLRCLRMPLARMHAALRISAAPPLRRLRAQTRVSGAGDLAGAQQPRYRHSFARAAP